MKARKAMMTSPLAVVKEGGSAGHFRRTEDLPHVLDFRVDLLYALSQADRLLLQ
jgi:hypothetical protein